MIFTHRSKDLLKYDIGKLTVAVASDDETVRVFKFGFGLEFRRF